MGRSYSLVQGNFKGACYPLIPSELPRMNNGLKAIQFSFSSPTHFISPSLSALICARPTIGRALKRGLIPALGIPGDLPNTGWIIHTQDRPARKWLRAWAIEARQVCRAGEWGGPRGPPAPTLLRPTGTPKRGHAPHPRALIPGNSLSSTAGGVRQIALDKQLPGG